MLIVGIAVGWIVVLPLIVVVWLWAMSRAGASGSRPPVRFDASEHALAFVGLASERRPAGGARRLDGDGLTDLAG